MGAGKTATEAATIAIARIVKLYKDFNGALVAVSMDGKTGTCVR